MQVINILTKRNRVRRVGKIKTSRASAEKSFRQMGQIPPYGDEIKQGGKNMAQKRTGKASGNATRKTAPATKRKTSGSSAKSKTSSTATKRTKALSATAKVSDFSGLRTVTVTDKKITVNGQKRFSNNRQNPEIAIRELKKRGVKSVTYRV